VWTHGDFVSLQIYETSHTKKYCDFYVTEFLKVFKIVFLIGQTGTLYNESGDFATQFFLVRQHWGGCRYRHFADNFKAL